MFFAKSWGHVPPVPPGSCVYAAACFGYCEETGKVISFHVPSPRGLLSDLITWGCACLPLGSHSLPKFQDRIIHFASLVRDIYALQNYLNHSHRNHQISIIIFQDRYNVFGIQFQGRVIKFSSSWHTSVVILQVRDPLRFHVFVPKDKPVVSFIQSPRIR